MKSADRMGFGKFSKFWKNTFVMPSLMVLTLGACDQMTDQEHVEKAKQFQNDGNFRASEIEFKNALEKNPDNLEARRLLGLVSLRMGNGPAAEKELKRAMDLGVAKEALLLPLAEALQLQGKYQEVLDLGDAPAGLSPGESAAFKAYRGDAWLGLGKPDKAKAEYEEALSLDQRAPLAKVGLARIAVAGRDLGQASHWIREALDADPDNPALWRAQAQIFQLEMKLPEAEASFSKAIEKNPAGFFDLAMRALVRIDLKKFGEAAQDIAELKKRAPDQLLTHHAAGVLAFTEKRFPDALAELEEANRLDERDVPTLFFLGATQLQLGHFEQADQALTHYLAAAPGSVKGIHLLALAKFNEKDWDRARDLLKPLLRQRPNDSFALKLMAQIEFGQGRAEQGLEYIERAVEQAPTSPEALTQLATGYMATGEVEKGQETLNIALNLDPKFLPAEFMSAYGFIKAQQYDKAEAVAAKLGGLMKDSPIPANLMGIIQRHKGNMESARASFKKALETKPGWTVPAFNLVQIDMSEKNYQEARQVMEDVLKADPNNLGAQLQLAEIDAAENKIEDMRGRLEAMVKDHPDELQPRLVLARYYMRTGQAQSARSLVENLRPKYGNNPDLLALLVETELASGQSSRAVESAQALVNTAPKLPVAHFLLARAYAQRGDTVAAMNTLEKVLELEPKSLPARLALVQAMALSGKTEAAGKQLLEIAREHPNDPEVMSGQGWLAMQQRKFGDAVTAYRKVAEMRPSSQAEVDLAQAYWLSGQKDSALRTLEDWIDRNSADTQVGYLLSLYYREMGKGPEILAQLEQILKHDPNFPQALGDLAWELRIKDPSRALELSERAVQIVPKSPLLLDTLGMVLLENGQNDRAVTILRSAQTLDSGNSLLQYHLAVALSHNGRREESITELESLLARKRDFPERREAEKLLAELKEQGAQSQ